MLLKIKVKSLSGDSQVFTELDPNTKISSLKDIVIKNHNSIKNLFSKDLLDRVNLQLFYHGSELPDDYVLSGLDIANNDTIIFKIKSNSIGIQPKNQTLFNSYKISPCNITQNMKNSHHEDTGDIFMDSFETNEYQENHKHLLGQIKQHLRDINDNYKQLVEKITTLENYIAREN